jgi:hypothetical protein
MGGSFVEDFGRGLRSLGTDDGNYLITYWIDDRD